MIMLKWWWLNMKNKMAVLLLIVVGVFLYAATLRGMVGNPRGEEIRYKLDQATQPFELSPERSRYLLVLSLAENKSLALTKELADAAYPDDGYYKGKYYIFFAPGVSLYALPFYFLFKPIGLAQVGTYSFVSIIAIVNLCLIFVISRKIFTLNVWMSLFASLVFGFATTSWSYAITLYQHHFTTFFMLLSFYSVWRYRMYTKNSWVWGIVVWTAYALAILVDYPNAVLLLPVIVYMIVSGIKVWTENKYFYFDMRLSLVTTTFLFVVITAVHAYFNTVNFGGPLKVSGGLVGHRYIVENSLENSPDLDAALVKAASEKDPVGFFQLRNVSFGLYTLFVAPDRGLFRYIPVFVLAIPGVYLLWKKFGIESKILIFEIFAFIVLYSMWGDPWGGWSYGPRYFIPIMPILSIAVAYWLSLAGYEIAKKILAYVLLIPSAGIAILGAITTNANPPEVEGHQLEIPYTYVRNLEFLYSNRSGSIVYNMFFSHNTLMIYFWLLFVLVMFMFFVVLFILPMNSKNATSKGGYEV